MRDGPPSGGSDRRLGAIPTVYGGVAATESAAALDSSYRRSLGSGTFAINLSPVCGRTGSDGPTRSERIGTERTTEPSSTRNASLRADAGGSSVTSPEEVEGVIADVGIEPADFPLEGAIDGGGVRCTIEQFVTTEPDRLTVFLWVEGDLDGLEESLASDEGVERILRVIDNGERCLYRMDWIDRIDPLVRLLREERGAVLSASATAGGWRLRLLVPTREGLSRLYDYCRELGIGVEIHSLYNVDADRRGQFGLTTGQEELLYVALERGYYDIPRNVDMEELADEFGVSHQAISERLRRAHGTLVENALRGRTENRDDVTADASAPLSSFARSP